MPEAHSPSRARIIFAGVLIAGLAAAALLVPLLAGGNDETEVAPADPDCIQAWNDERLTILLGRHQATAHQYRDVQILRLDDAGEPVAEGDQGNCAVVFAATTLDPEPGASAQVLIDGKWGPLSEVRGVTPGDLGQFQSGALEASNGLLSPDGTLAAKPASD